MHLRDSSRSYQAPPEEFQEHVRRVAPDLTVHVMKPGDDLTS